MVGGGGRASWVGFFYSASLGSLGAFTAFAWLVQIWPPERLATDTFGNPMMALVLGRMFAGEHFGLREVAATAVILSAVAVAVVMVMVMGAAWVLQGRRTPTRSPR